MTRRCVGIPRVFDKCVNREQPDVHRQVIPREPGGDQLDGSLRYLGGKGNEYYKKLVVLMMRGIRGRGGGIFDLSNITDLSEAVMGSHGNQAAGGRGAGRRHYKTPVGSMS